MIKSFMKFGVVCLLTVAAAGLPAQLYAQSAEKPATENKEPKSRKPDVTPFNGKLKGVDKDAKTIAVGTRIFKVTSETKITKDGLPATLANAVIGENVGGAFRTAADGTLQATTINFGKKAEAKR